MRLRTRVATLEERVERLEGQVCRCGGHDEESSSGDEEVESSEEEDITIPDRMEDPPRDVFHQKMWQATYFAIISHLSGI